MLKSTTFFIAILATSLVLSLPVKAQPALSTEQAQTLVQPFYDFLSGKSQEADVRPAYHADWQSFYNNGESRNLDKTLGFIGGPLRKMIPDLSWKIEEVIVGQNNTIIVRGRATGTPAGDKFRGQDIMAGKNFDIMSLDVHYVDMGKIVKTYHIEDWAGAYRQLSPKQAH